jgi:peroxisomal 3,2-trans-enoyl-CoA isomerase
VYNIHRIENLTAANNTMTTSTPVSTTISVSRRKTLKIHQRPSINALALTVVAIDRPKVRNAINDDVYLDLIDVLHQTSSDTESAGIILTGSGPYFTSGADLNLSSSKSKSSSSSTLTRTSKSPTLQQPSGRFMMALLDYPKLICAAVNGPAVGIGTTLLFHCDLVFASKGAFFWSPFTRIALVPELCSSVTFLSSMGLARTNELLMLGNKIDADTAYSWGICSRIVDVNINDVDRDPFHPTSLATMMATEIENQLLTLPRSKRTIEYFISMVRHGSARSNLRQVCIDELRCLDERRSFGDMDLAIESLQQKMMLEKKNKQNMKNTNDNKRTRSRL